MSRWFTPALLLVVAVALAFRLPYLDQRPMHNDEGVNAIKFRSLLEQNAYRYDPKEFHGPILPYATLLSAWLNPSGNFNQLSEASLRMVPVVFGVGLILLLFLLSDGLGKAESLCAAALTALSPAMVYYSRYYIHEMLLVFFSTLALVAGWRYSRSGNIGWCLLLGTAIGLMHATKETFVFVLFALGLAAILNLVWERQVEGKKVDLAKYLRIDHIGLTAFVALVVSIIFFSSFFTNANGPLDSLKTYSTWIQRAGGESPHVQSWHFYFRRLLFFHYPNGPYWSEGLILALALAGGVAVFRGGRFSEVNPGLARIIAGYTVILAAIYTVLPYKTPWCALGFWQGAILLAGIGAVVVARCCQPRWLRLGVVAAIAIGAADLGWQAWRASYPYSASQFNPYVYAHTSPDILKLVARVEALSNVSPEGHQMLIKVMSPANDYWPLPWYLRQFKNVGWWGKIPSEPLAPVVIAASNLDARFDERPEKTHLMAGYYQLRPRVFLELYVELNLWREYVKSLPREVE